MAPPSFADIGKQSRDVFGKGFHFGVMKLQVKSKTSTGVEFTAGGNRNMDGVVAGNIETKWKCSDHGVTFTEKWNTDNTLNATFDMQDKILPGLKLTLDGTFKPASGDMSGKLKEEYKHEKVVINTDMNLSASPVINSSISLGHGNFVLGYNTAFDSGKAALTKHNFALGYSTNEMNLHCTANDSKVLGGGIYHRVNKNLETGVTVSAAIGGNNNFGIGCKYNLGPDASIRAKVDNSSKVGLSYQQTLRPGIDLVLSGLFDGTKLNQAGHKIGLSLEMSA